MLINAVVTIDEDVRRIISDKIKHYDKLDVLVNDAGGSTSSSMLAPKAMQSFDNIMALNVGACVYLTNFAAPYIVDKRNIINISIIGVL